MKVKNELLPCKPEHVRAALEAFRIAAQVQTQHLTVKDYVDERFKADQPEWGIRLALLRTARDEVHREWQRLQRGLVARLFQWSARRTLLLRLQELDQHIEQARIRRARAFQEYQLVNAERAAGIVAESEDKRRIQADILSLEARLEVVERNLEQLRRQGFDLSDRISDDDVIATCIGSLAEAEHQVGALETSVRRAFLDRAAYDAAIRASDYILATSAPMRDLGGMGPFVNRTSEALYRQLAGRPSVPTMDLENLLASVRDPRVFSRPCAWLVFWTSIKATGTFSRQALGTRMHEDQLSAIWCNAWQQQFGDWNREVLHALGLTKEEVHIARGHFQSVGTETRTGADVLLALTDSTGGRNKVRIALIQFKKDDVAGTRLNVWQDGLRQYRCLEVLDDPRRGVTSMHAVLSTARVGLAATAAVSLGDSRAAINAHIGRQAGASSADWSANDCILDWSQRGESLSTMLSRALSDMSSEGFGTAKEAFDWLASTSGARKDMLPRQIIVQAVGAEAMSMASALLHEADRWGRSLGYTLERVDRTRNRDRSRGPSMGR